MGVTSAYEKSSPILRYAYCPRRPAAELLGGIRKVKMDNGDENKAPAKKEKKKGASKKDKKKKELEELMGWAGK